MSMGESTRRRLEGAVRNAAGGNAPAQYVGGWQGGLGGTWAKAGTNRGSPGADNPPARPGTAGNNRPGSAAPGGAGAAGGPAAGISTSGHTPRYIEPSAGADGHAGSVVQKAGVREKTRPASAGVKSVWHDAHRELPKAPPHALTTGKVRPNSATMARTTKPLANTSALEYKLKGVSLDPRTMSLGGGGGGGGGAGMRGSGTFGTPPATQSPRTAHPHRGGASGHHHDPQAALDKSRRDLEAYRSMEASDGGPAVLSEAHLAALEDALRDAVRANRSVYEGSKEMLLKLFRAVDDGSGDVSIPEFCAVCAQVGISVSPQEGAALFQRFGCDTVMPYEKFVHTLVTQPARQLAEDMPVRKGPFQAGGNANFHGKILYRHCRKPVYTPSDWDPALADRSADLPQSRLVLDFIYGYQGHDNTSQNLFYTSEGKLVYYTAGVGVVYQRPPVHHQYFYLGHTDDITAIAICRAEIDLAGRTYPERTLVATGQVTSTEEGAYISIWDSRVGSAPDGPAVSPELVRIPFDKDSRGITALAFSPCGRHLVAVATDNQHTVYVYDWRKQRLLSSGKGQMGDPPQVYGVEWNPVPQTFKGFVTFGRKHIKMWALAEGGGGAAAAERDAYTARTMSFGRQPMQNVTSAQWLSAASGGPETAVVVAGVADGCLYMFKGLACVRAIAAHRPGPQVIQADGHPAHHGVRGLRVIKKQGATGTILLSGGADGTILQWEVTDGQLVDSRFAGPSMQLKSPFGVGDKFAPCIRALDYSPELDKIVVGTNNCDINELTPTTNETLMDGHSGDVYFLATHPARPNILCTVSDSGHIHVWDTNARQMTLCAALGWVPRAVAYSATAVGSTGTHHIAVGGVKGHLKILDETDLKPLHSVRDSKEGIHDIKYSPNSRFLAVATFDTWIDIYNVSKEYSRVARCSGHSSTVRTLDWSLDSSVVQSASADQELLTWNARTGKQITMPQRDVQYHTYTSFLGLPVMGIYPPFADGTEVNALDRSKSQKLVVTADDHGLVKLFNYPCVVEDAPHRAYRGHSSHVMGVRFNSDDSLVCSAGGHDWAIFQFKVVHIQPEAAPPAPPKPVWGPLDPQGKTYGYTTNPCQLSSTTTGSPARGTTPLDDSTPLQGSPAVSGGTVTTNRPDSYSGFQGEPSMAPIQEEVSSASVASLNHQQPPQQRVDDERRPARPTSPLNGARGLPGGDVLQQNPAPTRFTLEDEEEGAGNDR